MRTTGMIEKVTIPFTGPPHHAQAYLGTRRNTRLGVGRVQEADYKPDKHVLVLHVYVAPKKPRPGEGGTDERTD